jgi:integrase
MPDDFNGDPSRGKSKAIRPPKPPVRNFPLYAHALGYWSKKIRGRTHNFGRWGRVVKGQIVLVAEDGAWQAALALYQSQREELEAGRTPRAKSGDGLTVKELCDRFYTEKKRKCDAGEMTQQSLDEYDATCRLIVAAFGRERRVDDLTPEDFAALRSEMVKRWGPVRLGNTIGRVRTVFKYGFDFKLLDRPMAFGSFQKPGQRIMRKHRREGGERLFTADEIRRMLAAAGPQLRCMILLAINAAFGNHDCGSLPTSALDLKTGWVRFPRPKTEVDRRCPLWPETIEALKACPAKDAYVFSMKCSRRANSVTRTFGRLLESLEINGRRGLGFYALRHTFRTIADNTKDFPAIRMVMGHSSDGSIDGTYVENIDDSRLRAVTDYVHDWLFHKSAEAPTENPARPDEPAKPKRQRKPKAKPVDPASEGPALRLFIA